MSITSKPLATSSRQTQITIQQSTDDIANLADNRDKTLVIILSVTLPTLALIGILILFIVCYRKRHATVWLKKIEHSSRLQAIVVNLSSSPILPELAAKKPRLSHRSVVQPRTETIVYNRLNTPPTPISINPFLQVKLLEEGQTNAAFDDHLAKHEVQPIFRSVDERSSDHGKRPSIIYTQFPVSLQAPVRRITSTLVETIAAHRLSFLVDSNNTSSSLETTTTNSNHNQRHSGVSSCSNSSNTVLLFSQRTEL